MRAAPGSATTGFSPNCSSASCGAAPPASFRWYAEHGQVVDAVRHAQAAQDWELAVRLPDHGDLGGASAQLVEQLTDSEARILRYLPTNLSAPEMADQLCVSVHTVRTHMRHVYEKLGAHRRADAVDRARGLGLLAPSPHRA
jgi:ATP/maltotriose-dependent transcriptional regulator MalT